MPTFQFDIVSEIDKAEMNNVFAGVEREIATRYDFKNTQAALEWLENKGGFKIIGDNQYQVDAVMDIVRKKLASRNLSSKSLDLSAVPHESNLRVMWSIPFKEGLDKELAKRLSADIKTAVPKVKAQIQGDSVRVTSSSKDELQKVVALTRGDEYDVPLNCTNFR
ncbi:YajQ family cyclic di-GMP-binding protein [Candidatus Saccharibacteria bacterium]|nr:YajQ family cyclic di-GMP-binding protein [Candidatus Saccharibacteria bacterium]